MLNMKKAIYTVIYGKTDSGALSIFISNYSKKRQLLTKVEISEGFTFNGVAVNICKIK